MPYNPLNLTVGGPVVVNEPYCMGLGFRVQQVDHYVVDGFTITDYQIVAPCSDDTNPYAWGGRVELWIRALPIDDENFELVLLWGEDPTQHGAIVASMGNQAVVWEFADGRREYWPIEESPGPFVAQVTTLLPGGTTQANEVTCWAYQAEARVVGGDAPAYTQYLLVERVTKGPAAGNTWIRRGYTIEATSVVA